MADDLTPEEEQRLAELEELEALRAELSAAPVPQLGSSPQMGHLQLSDSIDPGPAPYPSPDYPAGIMDEVTHRFGRDIVDPAIKLGAAGAAGYASMGLSRLIPGMAALSEMGLLGRLGSSTVEAFAGNAGAQVPLSMVDDSNYFHELNPLTNPIQSAVSYGVPLASEAIGSMGRWLGSANRTEAMRGVFSQNNSDYIPSTGRMGVPAAVEEIAPILNDPSIGSAAKPVSELARRVDNAQALAGQRVGAIVDRLDDAGARVPTAMIDPDAILPGQAGGASGKASDAVAKVEYEAMAKKAFTDAHGPVDGISAYDSFSEVRKLSGVNTNPNLFEAHPGAAMVFGDNPTAFFEYQNALTQGRALAKRLAGGAGEAADLDVINDLARTVASYDGQIKMRLNARLMDMTQQVSSNPAGAKLVHRLRQDFDAKAGYPENKGTIREEQYRVLADSMRGQLQGFADQYGLGEAFRSANQRYSALAELNPLAQTAAAPELRLSPSSTSDIASVRVQLAPPYIRPQIASRQIGSARGTQGLLQTAYGQNLGQRVGGVLANAPALGSYASGSRPFSNLMNNNDSPSARSPLEQRFTPPLETSPTPQSLTTNLVPPAIPSDGVPYLMPRTITRTDPQVVEFMINHFLPPQEAPFFALHWKRMVASQDLEGMASFLGVLKEKAPDIPMGPGPVTGLNSEFDLGDGRSRLFNPMEYDRWRKRIEDSPLRTDEKAQRIAALHRDGTVYPLDVRVNEFEDSSSQSLFTEDVRSATMSNFTFADRERTPMGSQKSQSVER